jgi:competence protein ComEC
MLRPALPAATMLMLGIFFHEQIPLHPWVLLGTLGVLTGVALALFRRPLVCSILLLVACLVAGIALARTEHFYYPGDHISEFATDQPRLARLELRLDYPPRVLTAPFGQFRALPPKQVVTATVLRIKTWTGWADCNGEALVQISQPNPRLAQGQRVEVIGTLERPGPAMNPGQFDWASYYRDQRILASVQIAQAGNIEIKDDGATGAISWIREQTRRLLARGFPENRLLDHALLRALVLGDSDPELRDVQEQFRRTGTSHHLAISGMHVAVLGGVVFGVCRLLRIGPRRASWISLILVILYGVVALPSPPVVRSVLLCIAFALGILNRQSINALQLLAVTVIAMLVYHPLDLYNAGFQLSFGTVLGLMIFTRPVMHWIPILDLDEQIAMAMQRPSKFSILGLKTKEYARATLAASVVAWVVSMPLIAYHFEQLNPWAIVASIALAPIVFAALICGFFKVLLTLLWPSASSTWAMIAAWPVAGMRHTVDWLATFPGAEVPLPSPPVWMIVLFYALLLSLLIPWRWRVLSGFMHLIAIAGCLMLAIFPLRSGFSQVYAHAGDLKVTLLAVGAGQCAVVEPPGADAIVVDAGSAYMSDMLRKVVGPFLRHQGRREIGSIFISHPNYDHFSAVAEMTAAYDVNAVFVSPQFRRQCTDNPPAEGLLRMLDQLDRPPRETESGRSFDLGSGAKLDVVWPPHDLVLDVNNNSLVLRLSYAGKSILLPGDLAAAGERELMKTPDLIKADVLVAPHHGSNESTTVDFVNVVHPEVIVCSNDRTLSMKQREFDQEMQGRTVYRTHISGAITIRISREGTVSIETYLPKR